MRRRAALAAALAVLGGAGPAQAHVVPEPSFVAAGATTRVGFAGPNERDERMTGFAIFAPEGVRIVRAHASEGWQVADADEARVTWTGGSLAPNEEETFHVELEATTPPGPAALEAEQLYPGGEVVRWDVPLTVVPAAESPGQNLGWTLVAGLVGLLVAVAVVAFAWRRRSAPPDGAAQ
ncbi:MAG: hypothetical protein R6W48_07945 [Gaiellaceae bacterium]